MTLGQNASRCTPRSCDTAATRTKCKPAMARKIGACRSSIRVHPPEDSGIHPDVIRQTIIVSGIHSTKYVVCHVSAERTLMFSPGRRASHQICTAYTIDTNSQKPAAAAAWTAGRFTVRGSRVTIATSAAPTLPQLRARRSLRSRGSLHARCGPLHDRGGWRLADQGSGTANRHGRCERCTVNLERPGGQMLRYVTTLCDSARARSRGRGAGEAADAPRQPDIHALGQPDSRLPGRAAEP